MNASTGSLSIRCSLGSAEPAFSPDGRRLAYTRTTGDFTGQVNIVGVGADGKPVGAPTRVVYNGQEAHSPTWTPDGRSLLVIDGSSTSNGGVARVPVDAPGTAVHLGGLDHAKTIALSRDGTKLVFSRGGDNSDDLAHRRARRRRNRRGWRHPRCWDGGAEYSPDGQRIAFSSNRGGASELWVANANGDNAQPVTSFNGPDCRDAGVVSPMAGNSYSTRGLTAIRTSSWCRPVAGRCGS